MTDGVALPRLDHVSALRSLGRTGIVIIALFAATLGFWAVAASLTGAVAAGGQFVVTGDVKKVQHPTGGVVGDLLVSEGQDVEAGAVLLRLDETVARANHQIVNKQLDEIAVRSLRLAAERDDLPALVLSDEVKARQGEEAISRLIEAETRLFEARRDARDGQRAQLRKRMSQLRDEIVGLRAQLKAAERAAEIIKIELAGVEQLYSRDLISIARLSELQRQQAGIEGDLGRLIAAIAQSEGRIAEIELQIIQIGENQRAEAMGELREIQARQGELEERRTAALDQLTRVNLRAPVAGTVHQLAVHTVGGVLQPGEPAMLIVPGGDDLEIEARVSPVDIDQVSPGQTVRVRVLAGHQSTNPELIGSVVRIGADVTRDEQIGLVFYKVRISVPREELERLAPLRVMAGMQAESYIETEARTPLDFLLKPLSEQLRRSFRER